MIIGETKNKPGQGRKNRIGVSLDHAMETDLKRLATSCGMPPTTMCFLIIQFVLQSADLVDMFQQDYNVNSSYWVFPVTQQDGSKRLEVRGND